MSELTRCEAIKIAGLELIEEAEAENCEHTNSVTNGTRWAGCALFSATAENETHRATAYYAQWEYDLDGVEDLSDLSWEIEHYEVEEL